MQLCCWCCQGTAPEAQACFPASLKGQAALAMPAKLVSMKTKAEKPSHWLWSMKEGECGGFAIQKNSSRTEKFQQNIF